MDEGYGETRFATPDELKNLADIESDAKKDASPFTPGDIEEIRQKRKEEFHAAREAGQEFNQTAFWDREIARLIKDEKDRFCGDFSDGG